MGSWFSVFGFVVFFWGVNDLWFVSLNIVSGDNDVEWFDLNFERRLGCGLMGYWLSVCRVVVIFWCVRDLWFVSLSVRGGENDVEWLYLKLEGIYSRWWVVFKYYFFKVLCFGIELVIVIRSRVN